MKRILFLLTLLVCWSCTVDPVPNTSITFKMNAGDFYSCGITKVTVQVDGVRVTTLNNPGNMGRGWVEHEAWVVGGLHSYSAQSDGVWSWKGQEMVQPPFGKTLRLCCPRSCN